MWRRNTGEGNTWRKQRKKGKGVDKIGKKKHQEQRRCRGKVRLERKTEGNNIVTQCHDISGPVNIKCYQQTQLIHKDLRLTRPYSNTDSCP